MGDGVVNAALVVDVPRGSDEVDEWRPELAERTDDTLTVLDGPGVAAGHRDGRPEVQFLVDHRQRWDRAEPDDVPELVRRVGDELTIEAQDVSGVLGRPEHRSGHDGGADGAQCEPELADDAEVPAAAPQRPEVDHDSVVAHRGAGRVVAPASYGDLEVAVAGEAHRCGHVGGAAAAGDHSRAPVDGAVPYGACAVVLMMLRGDHAAPEPGDLHRGWCCHRSSSGRWAHRNIGGHRGEVSYLDFEVRNLDFTAVERRETLRSSGSTASTARSPVARRSSPSVGRR